MVCVGIDVAKDKHDCCILDSEGTTLVDCFTIPNNMDGFKSLLQTIQDCSQKSDKIKVGLEATGHYSYNILGFLLDNDLPVYVMNPLHTNLYRKSLSLRKTKTDRVDAKTIATMLLSDVDLKSYSCLALSKTCFNIFSRLMVLTRATSIPANSMLAGMRSTPSAWCSTPSPGGMH